MGYPPQGGGGWGPPQRGYPPPQGYGYGPPQGYAQPMVAAPQVGIWKCPYCGMPGPPATRDKISSTGWAVFIALLILCFILCWVGFFIREDIRYCRHCGSDC